MKDNWEAMRESSSKGGGVFISLKDGDSVKGVFMGNSVSFWNSFETKTSYEFKPSDTKVTPRHRLNFLVNTDGAWTAKIFEFGNRVRDALYEATNEYGKDAVFKIKRSGTTKDDTVYHIHFQEKMDRTELKDVELLDLKPEYADVPF